MSAVMALRQVLVEYSESNNSQSLPARRQQVAMTTVPFVI